MVSYARSFQPKNTTRLCTSSSPKTNLWDMDIIQSQLDFFWLVGFCFVPMRLKNWAGSGVLIIWLILYAPGMQASFKLGINVTSRKNCLKAEVETR